MHLDYIIIDSKKWQHYFFGNDTSQIDLKKESEKLALNILTLYQKEPENDVNIDQLKEIVVKHGDGDSLLMCQFIKEKVIKLN